MIEIPGYKYISHKVVPRKTGDECRFTVIRESDGVEISDTIPAVDDLQGAISSFLTGIVPAEPVREPVDDRIEASMREVQSSVKLHGCAYIKHNPMCAFEEFIGHFSSVLPPEDAATASKYFALYRESAFGAGRISENTFTAFRDFVSATPIETLMSM